MVIATNFTSICFAIMYKEKIVKNDSYRITQRPYKFRKLKYSTRIESNISRARPPGVSALDDFIWFHVEETPSGNRRFQCIVNKQIKYIMKYQLYTNASN